MLVLHWFNFQGVALEIKLKTSFCRWSWRRETFLCCYSLTHWNLYHNSLIVCLWALSIRPWLLVLTDSIGCWVVGVFSVPCNWCSIPRFFIHLRKMWGISFCQQVPFCFLFLKELVNSSQWNCDKNQIVSRKLKLITCETSSNYVIVLNVHENSQKHFWWLTSLQEIWVFYLTFWVVFLAKCNSVSRTMSKINLGIAFEVWK